MHYAEVRLHEGDVARLDCYLLDPEISTDVCKTRPAIVIAPGGAYLTHAHREGEPVAARFLGLGFDVFVLRYRTYVTGAPTKPGGMPQVDATSHYPRQVVDAMRAMAYVRSHASEWHIDGQRIYLLGFSAGAHVVGSLAERYDDAELLAEAGTTAEVVRPAGLVLCYPMVSTEHLCGANATDSSPDERTMANMVVRAAFGRPDPTAADFAHFDLRRHIRPDLPRTFVWQTAADETVLPHETTELVAALQRAGVPVEYHLFERGPHGMALADHTTTTPDRQELTNDEAAVWVDLCVRWLAMS